MLALRIKAAPARIGTELRLMTSLMTRKHTGKLLTGTIHRLSGQNMPMINFQKIANLEALHSAALDSNAAWPQQYSPNRAPSQRHQHTASDVTSDVK